MLHHLWQVGDELVDVGLPGGGDHILHGHLPGVVSVGDVLRQAPVEEHRLLGHNAQLAANPGDI